MFWQLEDGTEIGLGGRVVGTSKRADHIRFVFELVRNGVKVYAFWGPIPSSVYLDLSKAYLIDSWLTGEYGNQVVIRPTFDAPPRPAPMPVEDDIRY